MVELWRARFMGMLVANRGAWVSVVCDSVVMHDVRKVENVVLGVHGKGSAVRKGRERWGRGEEGEARGVWMVDEREGWERLVTGLKHSG